MCLECGPSCKSSIGSSIKLGQRSGPSLHHLGSLQILQDPHVNTTNSGGRSNFVADSFQPRTYQSPGTSGTGQLKLGLHFSHPSENGEALSSIALTIRSASSSIDNICRSVKNPRLISSLNSSLSFHDQVMSDPTMMSRAQSRTRIPRGVRPIGAWKLTYHILNIQSTVQNSRTECHEFGRVRVST